MSAKFILSKVLGIMSVLTGLLFILAPDSLLNLLGIEYSRENLILLSFIIRLVGVRNLVSGVGMLILRHGP
jgi:hypothetical protein